MSLYEAMMEDFVLMEKQRTPDGYGGWTTVWTAGAEIKAAIHKDTTLDARIAENEGLTELYTITVYRDIPLEFHDVLRRVSDGEIFRVTSNIRDNTSPRFSGINFGQVTAERWELV